MMGDESTDRDGRESIDDVVRAVGVNDITEGTLVSVLDHVFGYSVESAETLVASARTKGVVEEVRPGVLRVTEDHQSEHEASD